MGPYAGVDYNLTVPYVDFKVDANTITMGPYARVDLNTMPELTLSPNQELRIWSLDPDLSSN
jgi:hypothetical protein